MFSPIAIVAGMGKRTRSIGKERGLIWTVPDDLRRFAKKTIGRPVIMGRKTFESIIALNGHPLLFRPNIVVSRNPEYKYHGILICNSLEEALDKAYSLKSDEIHIGGGSEIYEQIFPLVDRLYLTLFDDDLIGDTLFPDFKPDFREMKRHGLRDYYGLKYEWVDYVRKRTKKFDH